MINAILDLILFLKSNFTLLFSLALYTVLAIALAKSIKQNYKVYYWLFGLLSAGFIIPSLARLCGFTMPVNLSKIPFFGLCFSELSGAASFIHPVLIIIMYMGAFSPKNQYVGRLMSIRKELSIIVGFPVLAHTMKRLFGTFVGGWNYFFDHEAYIQSPRVTSVLGSGISSFVYVLGVVMFALFLVLWITSFDSVHRKLGTKRWKSVQKWSYGLYAMLFIHSMGLNLGGYISDKARETQQPQVANIEVVEQREQRQQGGEQRQQGGEQRQQSGEQRQQGGEQRQQSGEQQGQMQQSHGGQQQQAQGQTQTQQGGHGSKPQPFKLEEIEISRTDKRIVNMLILVLIYGSYLYFRLRKAKADKAKKATAKKAATPKK